MKWSLILLFAGSLFAQDAQRFFYSKSFPGSTPAYVQVTLAKNGEAVYRDSLPVDGCRSSCLPIHAKAYFRMCFGNGSRLIIA